MNDRKVAEAVLLLAEEPVPAGLIGELLEKPTSEVEELLGALAAEYREADRGFVLREVAGGWRLYSDPECGPWLERFVLRHRTSRLSAAALEVLAVVAYKGPISRAHIAEIRGVESDGVVKTLAQRGMIEEVGRESGPGAPAIFQVTSHFLERMGLRSTEDLPPLAGFIPDAEAVEDMEAKLSPNA